MLTEFAQTGGEGHGALEYKTNYNYLQIPWEPCQGVPPRKMRLSDLLTVTEVKDDSSCEPEVILIGVRLREEVPEAG